MTPVAGRQPSPAEIITVRYFPDFSSQKCSKGKGLVRKLGIATATNIDGKLLVHVQVAGRQTVEVGWKSPVSSTQFQPIPVAPTDRKSVKFALNHHFCELFATFKTSYYYVKVIVIDK